MQMECQVIYGVTKKAQWVHLDEPTSGFIQIVNNYLTSLTIPMLDRGISSTIAVLVRVTQTYCNRVEIKKI